MHIQKDILTRALCLGKGVLGTIRLEKAGGKAVLVASCRPRKGQECRCPECGEKAPVYDHARQPRRWRTMDIGTMPAYIEHAPARVKCPRHGILTASVPWAEPGSRFTRVFEDQVAWLAVQLLHEGGVGAHENRLAYRRRHLQEGGVWTVRSSTGGVVRTLSSATATAFS